MAGMKKLLQDLLESEKKNYQDFVAHRCIAPSARMSTTAVVIHSDPDILGGTPVFAGTRVPIQTLVDYLKAGDSIDEFLDGFPSVSRQQVFHFLDAAREHLVQSIT